MTLGAVPSRADADELSYLNQTFAELCRIESPSGRERACAERVIAELESAGVSVSEDDAGARAGSDCGNLLARIATSRRARDDAEPGGVLLCAHLDTVPPLAPIEPVLVDGWWENANEGILGADNKAAIAVILALVRHIRRDDAPVDVELLFTVGEETALAGARAFDATQLTSDFGYVFDHASPIGEVVVDSPTHFRIDAEFRGAAAHAGIRPEQGRSAIVAAAHAISAMRVGRLDAETTVNVGTIEGGSAMNVVPERCAVLAEVRALRAERAEEVVAEVVDRLHEAANL
ncbi:MAG TPA: M20/M25/M40 family metallo-hydrolase, partial [Solirubrobacteraceae bacterium]|nr:M20/M25/M40 family metallo-hydrolase [Solirubrobacteraceae bacterium]